MFLQIGDTYFNVDHIACIRSVSGGDQCVIFTPGQSSVADGFLIDLPIEEVFEMVQQARLLELAQMMDDEDEPGESDPTPPDRDQTS